MLGAHSPASVAAMQLLMYDVWSLLGTCGQYSKIAMVGSEAGIRALL